MLMTLTLVAVAGIPSVQAADDQFLISGSGWGHGVGMSQYGSEALANEGWTAVEIAEYYYSGTTVRPLSDLPSTWIDSDSQPLWLGIDRSATTMPFAAIGGNAQACLSAQSPCPSSASLTVDAGSNWEFRAVSGGCRFYRNGSSASSIGSCNASVTWNAGAGVRISLPTESDEYSRGKLMFRSTTGTSFHTVLRMGVEDFLMGVSESILKWHPEALKAQVLASRTHAVYSMLQDGPEASFSDSLKANCWCHLSEGLDQAYRGWSVESYPNGYGAKWVNAVQSTEGLVITHPDTATTRNSVILALFASSNGGKSAANQDVWSGAPYPYLQTVDDPWSVTSANPRAHWTSSVSPATIEAWLGFGTVERVVVLERYASGSVKLVRFDGVTGGKWVTVTKTGKQIRSQFGLYSTWFSACRVRAPFVDDDCSYFEPNIRRIADAGFTDGYGDGTYGPKDAMTRASMAEFLARGLGLPAAGRDYFTDDNGLPEEGWINSLAAAGITVGYPDGTYRPSETVTRAEMAVFLARAMGVFNPATPSSNPFPDVPADSWFGPAVALIADAGVTTGYMDGTFGPDNLTLRGEMAAFIDRALLGGH